MSCSLFFAGGPFLVCWLMRVVFWGVVEWLLYVSSVCVVCGVCFVVCGRLRVFDKFCYCLCLWAYLVLLCLLLCSVVGVIFCWCVFSG